MLLHSSGEQATAFPPLAPWPLNRRPPQGAVLDQVHDWGQSLRENSDSGLRNRFNQWEAMLECQASLTIALGYRDLKPAVVGTCALPGTDLEGRYERLLHDLRSNWTDASGRQALQAVAILKQRIDTLEAGLSRESGSLRPSDPYDGKISGRASSRRMSRVRRLRGADSRAPNQRYGAFLLGHSGEPGWADLGPAA